jgi:hypothetical protein
MNRIELGVVAMAFLSLSCSSARWGRDPVNGSIQSAYWKMQMAGRSPGAKLEDGPESVSKEYKCGEKNLPFIQIEKNEIIPPRVEPGGKVNHRLIYVACTTEPAGVIRGTLHRRIYFKAAVTADEGSDFEVQPGRWTLDAFTTVPKDAEAGVYALEVEFDTPKARFREIQSFQVE